ncbi:alpha/beta fold hydrolase [Collimonas humicola]|uniref:alpha/beta fold hydrolase n=1 Tax=Collimonas humicola TaxID=2825886 RepID=UPI001B8C5296|nr:alpha/beta hydrolase [Collimonas humicola]
MTDPIHPILHFVHGNSFPAGTYRQFLDFLRRDYDVRSLDIHAHNPKYPVTDGWPALVQELIDELAARYSRPVILVGHSMGGGLSLLAAQRRPDLVSCVVMLDTPVVAGWRATLLRGAKALGLDNHVPPARFSAKRRNLWPSAEAAYQHFAGKQVFANWAPEVLRDYITCGLEEEQGNMVLRFRRDIETAVYRTLPHNMSTVLKRGFPVPIGFVGGVDSVECRQAGLDATKRLVGKYFKQIPGGHLFPMESPELAAATTRQMIESLLNRGEAKARRSRNQASNA